MPYDTRTCRMRVAAAGSCSWASPALLMLASAECRDLCNAALSLTAPDKREPGPRTQIGPPNNSAPPLPSCPLELLPHAHTEPLVDTAKV